VFVLMLLDSLVGLRLLPSNRICWVSD
jgi:hypothetical protein